MINLKCRNCGSKEQKNILPGKHAVFGAIANINRNADCCTNPDYTDSAGFKKDSVNKGLRELVTAFKA